MDTFPAAAAYSTNEYLIHEGSKHHIAEMNLQLTKSNSIEKPLVNILKQHQVYMYMKQRHEKLVENKLKHINHKIKEARCAGSKY